MTDIISATTVDTYTQDAEAFKGDSEAFHALQNTIGQLLVSNNISIENVLFAGHGSTPKAEGSEHWDRGEKPLFYFGDAKSLMNPHDLTQNDVKLKAADAEERAEDHWAVNPLQYALARGQLSMYDKSVLAPLALRHIPEHMRELASDDISTFGTYEIQASPELIESAKLATLHIQTTDTKNSGMVV